MSGERPVSSGIASLEEEIDELRAANSRLMASNDLLRRESERHEAARKAVIAALHGAPVPVGSIEDHAVRHALYLRREAWPPARAVLAAAKEWSQCGNLPSVDPRRTSAISKLVAAVKVAEAAQRKAEDAAHARFLEDSERMHSGLLLRRDPDYPEVVAQLERLLTAARDVLDAPPSLQYDALTQLLSVVEEISGAR